MARAYPPGSFSSTNPFGQTQASFGAPVSGQHTPADFYVNTAPIKLENFATLDDLRTLLRSLPHLRGLVLHCWTELCLFSEAERSELLDPLDYALLPRTPFTPAAQCAFGSQVDAYTKLRPLELPVTVLLHRWRLMQWDVTDSDI